MQIEELVARYPILYHMAERDSWSSIREHGLLTAKQVAARGTLTTQSRSALVRNHRPEKQTVSVAGVGDVILRDQKPMEASRLAVALRGTMSVHDWYELINERVFFWAQRHRLLGLLGAREYRTLEHDVLTIDTRSLVRAHGARVWLCHMNSGNTFPMPHSRGPDTFKRIADYPVTRAGRPRKEVVEVTIVDGVPDIARYVLRVERMRGAEVLQNIFGR